jgi:hypothetical protein
MNKKNLSNRYDGMSFQEETENKKKMNLDALQVRSSTLPK